MALIIFLLLTLMVILSGPGTPPDYPSSDPGLGGSRVQEDVPEKEEDRLSGTWYCSARQTSGPGNYSYTGTVTIRQRGTRITISAQGHSASGTIRGNSISISRNYLIAGIHLSGTIINDNRIQWSIVAWTMDQRYGATATFTR